MNTTPRPEETPEDPEILREVYRALKACGWLFPQSIDEVRQAQEAIEEEGIDMPEELLDPFRILNPSLIASSNLELAKVDLVDIPDLPPGLAQLVLEVNLNRSQVHNLVSFHSQILFNRSDGKRDEVTYDDWKRFYLGVKEYL